MLKNKRIVITGIGPICSLGIGKKEVLKNLYNYKSNITNEAFYLNRELIGKYLLHKVRKYDLLNFVSNHQVINEINAWKKGEKVKDFDLLIIAIALAIQDSNISIDKEKIGMVLTHENPGLENLLSKLISKTFRLHNLKSKLSFKNYFKKVYDFSERSAYETQSFMMLHHASKIFGIHNYSLLINNACASGLYSMEAASQIIQKGVNDTVIVAASDSPGIYKHLWLRNIKIHSSKGITLPFSSKSDGFLCGEGGHAIIMEDYTHAKARNANIYAEYLGGGFSLESWKVTLPAISENYLEKAIIAALKNAKVKSCDIDFINPHGLGSKVGDSYEAMAISNIFKDKKPYVTAFKPYVGHNLGGAALLETILTILTMTKAVIPRLLNTECLIYESELNYAKADTPIKKNNTALKISYGFGGFDAAIVLRTIRGL